MYMVPLKNKKTEAENFQRVILFLVIVGTLQIKNSFQKKKKNSFQKHNQMKENNSNLTAYDDDDDDLQALALIFI